MRRFTLVGLLLVIGLLLATWGEATADRSEANVGTPTMQFRVESGASTCTPMLNPTKCTVPGTGVFQLAVAVLAFPAGGYSSMATDLDWTGTGLVYKPTMDPTAEVLLPGGTLKGRSMISPTRWQHASLSEGFGATPSMFKGNVVVITMTCPMMPSTNVINLLPSDAGTNPGGASMADSGGTIYPQSDSITINCALPSLDTDSDGCTDLREMGTNPMQGGLRNPNYFWDFYDTPATGDNFRDKVITHTGDILRVARRFGANDMMGMAPLNRNSDPLAGPPPPFPEYHPAFDRSPAPMGADPWDMGPPDGTISVVVDLFGVVRQIGHNCLN